MQAASGLLRTDTGRNSSARRPEEGPLWRPTPETADAGRYGFLAISAAVLLIQLMLLWFSFPLVDAFSGKISWHIDGPYHAYQLELGRSLLKQGALVGFDPFFGAGHLGGVTYNVSARLPVLIGGLFPDSLSSGLLYSLYVLACALIAPLSVVLATMMLRWPILHAALASLAGLAFWWIGALRWYHTAGMVSFVCASYLGMAYGVWIAKICIRSGRRPSWLTVILAGLAGGAGIWLHPLFGVIVAPWFIMILASNGTPMHWRSLASRATTIAAIAVTINLPWILAMAGAPNIANQAPYQKATGFDVALKPLLGIWDGGGMGSLLNPICAVICIMGISCFDKARSMLTAAFFGTGAMMLLFAAFGAEIEKVAILQPNRFIAPAFLFVAVGAAYCAGEFVRWLSGRRRMGLKLFAATGAVLLSAYVCREMYREAMPGPHGHYGVAGTELSMAPELVGELQSWILNNTSRDGRILFETSLGRIHGGGHSAGMLALTTDREFLGAPYPFSLPEISFWDNTAFGVPIDDATKSRLTQYIEHYNVGWIVAHSAALTDLAATSENVRLSARFGKVSVFEVSRKLSFFYAGNGHVSHRSFNRIDLTDIAGKELVLRYNWVPGLVTVPVTKIEPIRVEAGLPPLIRISDPPASLTISVCGTCPQG